ncbi:hypothetical protein KSP39_PZI012954 [Platanthera zijinensis]|uniref:Uncharacterized protein n=1 Tax=Platanthera zijinensis TaxID=2320716 RepID=A0AAP0G3P5_9ASPA
MKENVYGREDRCDVEELRVEMAEQGQIIHQRSKKEETNGVVDTAKAGSRRRRRMR